MPAEAACPLALKTATTLLALLLALQATPVAAQSSPPAVPETRDMIEALKPARNRNLLVRQTQPNAAAAATPVVPLNSAPSAAPAPAPTQAPATPLAVVAPAAPAPLATPATGEPPRPLAATPAPGNPVGAAGADGPPSLSLAIQFELNSARVRPESGAVLGNLVAAMTSPDLKASRFVIEGHTDARGNPEANKLLSQQRADEVRLYLVALGVHPARLKAVGKGSSDLVNVREPLSAANRRVRVVTLE